MDTIQTVTHDIFTLDFETTGVDASTCAPVEVALYNPTSEFVRLIDPGVPIPPETSAVHHITDSDVQGCPSWPKVREKLADILRTDHHGQHLPILVAHNALYEKTIIDRVPDGADSFPPVIWICTYKSSLRVWPDAPAHRNEVLRYWLGLGKDRGRYADQHPHSALHDCRVTYLLLQALLEHATIDQLVEWTEQPAKLPKMPMGKHYGQAWDTIPAPYLTWIVKQADMREDVKYCAQEELKRRR